MPTTRAASRNQPARLATSSESSPILSSLIVSMSGAVRRSPARARISPCATSTMTGATSAAAASSAASVWVWLKDELATISGLMSSAESIRSASSRSAPIRPASWVRVTATWVSRSSVRRVASRTRAASVRSAVQRTSSRATSVSRAVSVSPDTAISSRLARSSGVRAALNAVSTRRTRWSNAVACSAAMAIARSAVKSYWGWTASRAVARACSVRTALSNSIARGATMSATATSPDWYETASSGSRSDARMAVRSRMRIDAAIPSRVASDRVNRDRVGVRAASMVSGRRRARRDRIGRGPRRPGR